MGDDWASYERAWAQDPDHLPRSVCLPALIAEADQAVAATLANLSRDYDAVISGESRHTPAEPPAVSTEQESDLADHPNVCDPYSTSKQDGECSQSWVIAPPNCSASHKWRQLYSSLCFIQAPMVRCSRPAFRQVCRAWGTRISYTHMLMAESFVKSPHARHAEFSRYEGEDRLVVQLAAKSGPAAAQAALLLRPYCDGLDLNCGCPQRWAIKEGIGAALLERPEQVADMVRSIRNAMPDAITALARVSDGDDHSSGLSTVPPFLPCVVKMRIQDDLRRSVDFARQCEAAGASWPTVHGRTPTCPPSAAVRFEDVKLIRENLSVPVVLNGGVMDVSTAMEAALRTGCGGLMSANGLLDNPSMFYCGASRALMEEEMSFGKSPWEWSPQACCPVTSPAETAATGRSAEAHSPLRPVSFLWAPDRSAADAVLVRYTVPDMWQAAVTPREVISDFMRAAIRTDLIVPTTVQQVLRMARLYLSPAERNHLALLRSNVSVLSSLREIGVYVESGRIACE
ncbi:hypothetical protein LSCM4_00876 [Leishmania orientalis]|uniref:DUS-like FMN-binding domain-containing protein n=1 Tax=Leishmania orientalis TaxID=2249476 RepID=A0A836GHL3_9TRYP|nr:hypothetical protein LSCM4_00876 [Leishmania orientalis]